MSTVSVVTELQGTIVQVLVDVGESVEAGSPVALIESMKMHHDVVASEAGSDDERSEPTDVGQRLGREPGRADRVLDHFAAGVRSATGR